MQSLKCQRFCSGSSVLKKMHIFMFADTCIVVTSLWRMTLLFLLYMLPKSTWCHTWQRSVWNICRRKWNPAMFACCWAIVICLMRLNWCNVAGMSLTLGLRRCFSQMTSLMYVDHKTLQEMLGRQTLCVDETKVFDAAKRWAEAECLRRGHDPSPQQCREMLGDALYLLRFPTMTLGDFADGAGQSGLLSVQETNDLFFNFSANKKPELRFPTTPRKGRPLCCQRFISVNTSGMIFGTKWDCIKFSVDRDISVVGFGLYRTVCRNIEYEVHIAIMQCGETLRQQSQYICPDGSSNTVHVLFGTPLQIEAGKNYKACFYQSDVLLDIYGEGGKSHISYGGVNFTFTTFCVSSGASRLSRSTNVERGQIPEILFYHWYWCDVWYCISSCLCSHDETGHCNNLPLLQVSVK